MQGSTVFLSEGYGLGMARKLGAMFFAVQTNGPVQMASALGQGRELSLGLARGLAGFGMVKAATVERYTYGFGVDAGR